MPREAVECPVCRNEQVQVWWRSLEGVACVTDSDSVCECRESELVDADAYDAALLHLAQEASMPKASDWRWLVGGMFTGTEG